MLFVMETRNLPLLEENPTSDYYLTPSQYGHF